MRVHAHSPEPGCVLTFEIWEDAVSRAPDVADGHVVSFGSTPESLAAVLPEVELLVCVGAGPPIPLPAKAPRLRLVFCTFAGVDSLMPLDWLPADAVLLNNSGAHAPKAGEFAIMSLLMLASHVPALVADQAAQRWEQRTGTLLAGRRLTVVGLGSLGGESARRAKQFGMHVTGIRVRPAPHPCCDQVAGAAALDDMLPATEFLLLACPWTTANRHLLDARRIGLDVVSPEPVPQGHRLWRTANLLVTPHISSYDRNAILPRSLDVLMRNLRAMRDGQTMPNLVDKVRGY